MTQKELLNKIHKKGNVILETRKCNSENSIFTFPKNKIIEWFEEIRNFTLNEEIEDLKERLEIFISKNESFLNIESQVIKESDFQKMRQEFRECFSNTNYFGDN